MPTVEPVSQTPHGICQAGCLRLSAYLRNKFRGGDGGCYNPNSRTSSGAKSYHVDGQAIDVMFDSALPDERSRGDAMFAWGIQHAEELNLQEMIWNDKIITARRWSEGVRHYTGGDHGNHVHLAVGHDASLNWRPQGTQDPTSEDDLTPQQAKQLNEIWSTLYGGFKPAGGSTMLHDIEGLIEKKPAGTVSGVTLDLEALATAVADKLATRLKA